MNKWTADGGIVIKWRVCPETPQNFPRGVMWGYSGRYDDSAYESDSLSYLIINLHYIRKCARHGSISHRWYRVLRTRSSVNKDTDSYPTRSDEPATFQIQNKTDQIRSHWQPIRQIRKPLKRRQCELQAQAPLLSDKRYTHCVIQRVTLWLNVVLAETSILDAMWRMSLAPFSSKASRKNLCVLVSTTKTSEPERQVWWVIQQDHSVRTTHIQLRM